MRCSKWFFQSRFIENNLFVIISIRFNVTWFVNLRTNHNYEKSELAKSLSVMILLCYRWSFLSTKLFTSCFCVLVYGTHHVLVLDAFHPSTTTINLERLFEDFRDQGFSIRWVNDTRALAVFRNPSIGMCGFSGMIFIF